MKSGISRRMACKCFTRTFPGERSNAELPFSTDCQSRRALIAHNSSYLALPSY